MHPDHTDQTLRSSTLNLRQALTALSLATTALLAPINAVANPEQFHSYAAENTQTVDHQIWDAFLGAHVSRTDDNRTRFDYAGVTDAEHDTLKTYIAVLARLDPTTLSRNEAFAYWANLYNALTIDIVLEKYPVKSILRIRSGLLPGPWKRKLITVNGEKLSLDNIEHDILRPFFNDNRVHYAVNCASYGCPNLAERALTGANLDAMLDQGARDYVNHPRGVTIKDGKVTASSIYKWFKEDFGDSEQGVLDHLASYADPSLKAQLEAATEIHRYDYDWALNEK